VHRHHAPTITRLWLPLVCCALAGCNPPAQKSSPRTRGQVAVKIADRVVAPKVAPGESTPPNLRIVCAAPTITEICCALGLRGQIVGRTRYCTYPPGIESVPSIGALIDVNAETLLDLKPDLVLVSGHSRSMTDRFRELNIRYEALGDATLDDIYASIRKVGDLTGRSQTAADLVAQIKRDLEAIVAHFADVPRTRYLLLVGALSDPPTPPYVAGAGSFYGELLRSARHLNIVDFDDRPFGPLALEYIVRHDPEVILELDPEGKLRPGGDADALRVWGQIGPMRAVERKRIHVIPGPQHYLPGPRIAETLYALLDAIASSKDN
jgi:iron complex transport system substrate-binding protein